ncbi:MAG TPA: hypothetical protein VGG03_25540 [Thermoanaerobaculia bacterium]|jgi:hypothetical protein
MSKMRPLAWRIFCAALSMVLVSFVLAGGLSQADTGPGSQHNDPGPGDCAHKHGGLNTSYCTSEGASCTVGGKTGVCKTERQQCYCVVPKAPGDTDTPPDEEPPAGESTTKAPTEPSVEP